MELEKRSYLWSRVAMVGIGSSSTHQTIAALDTICSELSLLPLPTCLYRRPLLQNRPLFQAICPGSLWPRDNRWLLSRVQRLAGPAGGTGAFCPGWRHQPGQKALAPLIPFPLPPPEPFSSLVSCCSRLGREEFLLIHRC